MAFKFDICIHFARYSSHLCLLIVCLYCQAISADQSLDSLFLQGQEQYDDSNYESALEVFVYLIEQVPASSTYHHWLGRCYGRLAEQASWRKAISLAKKTLNAFEAAVELDPVNLPALRDLMQFYETAPRFVGGSSKKAAQIAERIQNMEPIENNQ